MLETFFAKLLQAKLDKENEIAKMLVEKKGLEDLVMQATLDKLNK